MENRYQWYILRLFGVTLTVKRVSKQRLKKYAIGCASLLAHNMLERPGRGLLFPEYYCRYWY
jgi:hypothetical protein